jgi:hypothetical protein
MEGRDIQFFLRRDLDPGASGKLVIVWVQHRIDLIIVDVKTGLFRRPSRQGSQE